MRATRVTAASCGYRLMAVAVRFHCDVTGCELTRRGVRRGAAEVSGSGGVQSVWAWCGGWSDLDPRLTVAEYQIQSWKQQISNSRLVQSPTLDSQKWSMRPRVRVFGYLHTHLIS